MEKKYEFILRVRGEKGDEEAIRKAVEQSGRSVTDIQVEPSLDPVEFPDVDVPGFEEEICNDIYSTDELRHAPYLKPWESDNIREAAIHLYAWFLLFLSVKEAVSLTKSYIISALYELNRTIFEELGGNRFAYDPDDKQESPWESADGRSEGSDA